MSEVVDNDSLLFHVSAAEVYEALRDAAEGRECPSQGRYLMVRCGLVDTKTELTEAGRALHKLRWVLRKGPDADVALGQALRQLTPLQVIEQELRGLGPVPEDGVLDLLRLHRAAPDDLTVDRMRPMLRWLNGAGVIVYSTKLKAVRSLAPAVDAALAGEISALAAMVSPRTPYLNIVRLRRVLRPLRGTVWWADPHFGSRAFEELAEEVNTDRVAEIRILSGDADNVLTTRSKSDLQRFTAEMAQRGVTVEWRVDARGVRDWHDRWIVDDAVVWNVPPVNTLFKSDFSEILPGSVRPPLQEWWERSAPRS